MNELQTVLNNLENRARYAVLTSSIFGAVVFFLSSYTLLVNNPTAMHRFLFVFAGGAFGYIYGTDSKRKLDDHRAVARSLLSLHESQAATKHNQAIPAEDVNIPSQPKLPNIPSVAAPAEVKEALNAAKAKAKPTIVAPAQEASTEPKKVVMKRKAK